MNKLANNNNNNNNNKHYFYISCSDNDGNYNTYRFYCRKSTAKHEKLKRYAGKYTYWFDCLTGSNWYRGGFFEPDFGFINATPDLHNNVHGVVYEGEVYLLQKIVLDTE